MGNLNEGKGKHERGSRGLQRCAIMAAVLTPVAGMVLGMVLHFATLFLSTSAAYEALPPTTTATVTTPAESNTIAPAETSSSTIPAPSSTLSPAPTATAQKDVYPPPAQSGTGVAALASPPPTLTPDSPSPGSNSPTPKTTTTTAPPSPTVAGNKGSTEAGVTTLTAPPSQTASGSQQPGNPGQTNTGTPKPPETQTPTPTPSATTATDSGLDRQTREAVEKDEDALVGYLVGQFSSLSQMPEGKRMEIANRLRKELPTYLSTMDKMQLMAKTLKYLSTEEMNTLIALRNQTDVLTLKITGWLSPQELDDILHTLVRTLGSDGQKHLLDILAS